MSGNAVTLTAQIAELGSLRYTPAGIPVIDLRLAHASRQSEAGMQRDTGFEIEAKAAGPEAVNIAKGTAGRTVQVQGFLDRRSRMSRTLVLHVTALEWI